MLFFCLGIRITFQKKEYCFWKSTSCFQISRFLYKSGLFVYWVFWFYLHIKTFTNFRGPYIFLYLVTFDILVNLTFKVMERNNIFLTFLSSRHNDPFSISSRSLFTESLLYLYFIAYNWCKIFLIQWTYLF